MADTLEEMQKEYGGKTLLRVALVDDVLELSFTSGEIIAIQDHSSCCETRYMRTDDALHEYAGAVFLSADISPVGEVFRQELEAMYRKDDDDRCHEVEFFRIATSKGDICFACHNEHSGYYGGFNLSVERKNG